MGLDYQQWHTKQVRHGVAAIVEPFAYFIAWPLNFIDRINANFQNQQTLINENTDLKARILMLNAKLQKYQALEYENRKLRAMLGTLPAGAAKFRVAQMLAVNLNTTRQQTLINQGSANQIYVGQPVLDADGVFGQVIQTTSATSRVLMLTDRQSAVPVQDNRNGLRGIAVGDGQSRLLLKDIPATADVRPGDMFVTSGLAQHFPAGYPVGKVTSVNAVTGQGFSTMMLKPTASLQNSRLLLLVWPQNYKQIVQQNNHLFHLWQTNNSQKHYQLKKR